MMKQRKSYYEALEKAQKGKLDITPWLVWFVQALHNAIQSSLTTTERVLRKAEFWARHQDLALNERQRKIVNRLWDGFEGNLTSQKYAKINHCSQDTALRDIQAMIDKGLLRKANESGRSTHYELKC